MRKALTSFLPFLVLTQSFASQPLAKKIDAKDFPSVAARIPYFEKRINAADVRIREQAVIEASHLDFMNEKDYVQFFKRMLSDADPGIRGKAVKKLHELWVPLEANELPATFTGYHESQIIAAKDMNLTNQFREQCRRGGATGGWAAYALGLLKRKEAVPDLISLGADANEFARYAAGRALFDCGAKKEAKDIFERLMAQTYEPRDQKYNAAGYRRGEVDPYYVALAARAHMEIDEKARTVGLKRLITLLGELEPSIDVNDQRLDSTRRILANVTGEFFLSHKEASEWLRKSLAEKK